MTAQSCFLTLRRLEPSSSKMSGSSVIPEINKGSPKKSERQEWKGLQNLKATMLHTLRSACLAEGDTVEVMFSLKMQGHEHQTSMPIQSHATHICDGGLKTDYPDNLELWEKVRIPLRTWVCLLSQADTSVKCQLFAVFSCLLLEIVWQIISPTGLQTLEDRDRISDSSLCFSHRRMQRCL